MRNDSHIDGIKDGSLKGKNNGTVGVFLDYPFDGESYDDPTECITFSAWYGGISYGTGNVYNKVAPAEYYTVDFKLDGIKLGDDLSKVTERYGTPTSVTFMKSDGSPANNEEDAAGKVYYYYFDGDGNLMFTATADGEIIQIHCTVSPLGIDDDRTLYGDETSDRPERYHQRNRTHRRGRQLQERTDHHRCVHGRDEGSVLCAELRRRASDGAGLDRLHRQLGGGELPPQGGLQCIQRPCGRPHDHRDRHRIRRGASPVS